MRASALAPPTQSMAGCSASLGVVLSFTAPLWARKSNVASISVYILKKMSVHTKIKAERLKRGLTYQQFGDAVGVTRGAVQQWEKGVTGPTRKNQPAVARFLKISVAELMSTDDDASVFSPAVEQAAAPELPATSTILLSLSDNAVTLGAAFDKTPVEIQEHLHMVLTDYVAQARREFLLHGRLPEFHQSGILLGVTQTPGALGNALAPRAGARTARSKSHSR